MTKQRPDSESEAALEDALDTLLATQRWEITLLTECTKADAEAALEAAINAISIGAIGGIAPYTDKFEHVDD